jgi:hypothetical protein
VKIRGELTFPMSLASISIAKEKNNGRSARQKCSTLSGRLDVLSAQ